jgi:cytidyltransferase-like protein
MTMVSTRSPLIFFDRLPAYVRNKDGLPVPLDDCRRELVVANGCFDLLTVGHLKVLRTAASLAPYLLVAINSDVSVRSLKGPDRPFVPQEERAQLVASLCWVEVTGCGVVKGSVLEKFGIDSKKWTGWAFGFGLERLAIASMDLPDIRLLWSEDPRVKKQLKLGQKFQEVSKFPPVIRDISFVVSKDFVPNNYFDLIREIGKDLVEQVELLDKYENAQKFGPDRLSYTYRVVYRSPEKTLKAEEVEPLHNKLYEKPGCQSSAPPRGQYLRW